MQERGGHQLSKEAGRACVLSKDVSAGIGGLSTSAGKAGRNSCLSSRQILQSAFTLRPWRPLSFGGLQPLSNLTLAC